MTTRVRLHRQRNNSRKAAAPHKQHDDSDEDWNDEDEAENGQDGPDFEEDENGDDHHYHADQGLFSEVRRHGSSGSAQQRQLYAILQAVRANLLIYFPNPSSVE